jgi:hypothetical protein
MDFIPFVMVWLWISYILNPFTSNTYKTICLRVGICSWINSIAKMVIKITVLVIISGVFQKMICMCNPWFPFFVFKRSQLSLGLIPPGSTLKVKYPSISVSEMCLLYFLQKQHKMVKVQVCYTFGCGSNGFYLLHTCAPQRIQDFAVPLFYGIWSFS